MRRPSNRYLIVRLGGRVGNQLFLFASGMGLARALDADLYFFSGTLHHRTELTLPTIVGSLYREPTPAQLLRVGQYHYPMRPQSVLQVATRAVAEVGRRMQHRSPGTVLLPGLPDTFLPELYDLDLPAYLVGWLQSERYFVDVAADVDAAIRLPGDVPELCSVLPGPTVAVHFRRGDYLGLNWALPMQYYIDALTFLADRAPFESIVAFGDDADFVDLAAERLSSFGRVVNAAHLDARALGHLALMAQCDHVIMANSSFSWWGAWLGDQRVETENRVVIAPSGFNEGGGRIPQRWIEIPSGVITDAT